MIQSKKILIGITGSIAAYKIAILVRLLIKNGAEVKVIMTEAAQQFVSKQTLSTLSKNEVLVDLFDGATWANHVMLGRWADVMLIAPATCNTIAKMANGICNNLLQAVYLSAVCDVMVAPAMDEDMWMHKSTIKNLETLAGFGNIILPVNSGELASGLIGEGRMAEPEELVEFLGKYFSDKKGLSGHNILITAGPTQESLDPVRYISNHSTGKMGIALATECAERGANVNLVVGPTTEKIPGNINCFKVKTAAEMYEKCMTIFPDCSMAIMSAAVADYTPVIIEKQKIKKNDAVFTVEFSKTVDILKMLGTIKTPEQILIGFALETNNERENALKKLKEKNADYIILNSLNDEGAGFGHETNKITIFDKDENEYAFDVKSKNQVAEDIINTILNK